MATSSCPKCSSSRFEAKEATPDKSEYKIIFIQCSSCGAVVGTTDYYNIPSLLAKIAGKLGLNLFD